MSSPFLAEFTDDNFEKEVLASPVPVLVDFWAQWCAPCKMLSPIVEELAQEYGGTMKIGKLDVDNSPMTASKYAVNSIPTLLFVKGGNVMDQHVGLLTKKALKTKIDQLL